MKRLFAASAILALTACMGIKPKEKVSDAGGDVFDMGEKVVSTDEGKCGKGNKAVSPYGRWEMAYKHGDVEVTTTLMIAEFSTTVTTVCAFEDEEKLRVRISVPSAVFPADQELQLKDSQEGSVESEGGRSCSAEIKAQTLGYSFNGSCLLVKSKGKTGSMTFIPGS